MPKFSTYVDIDIDVDELVNSCRKGDIKDLINTLIDYGHLPEYLKDGGGNKNFLELAFLEKLNNLSNQWGRISIEDEKTLEELFKKYL
jgi:hypothetical protein